jgi:hypothetical protein
MASKVNVDLDHRKRPRRRRQALNVAIFQTTLHEGALTRRAGVTDGVPST